MIIPKHLSNTQMICKILIEILKKFLMIWLLIWLMIKKLNPIVTDLFIRDRKFNIWIVFITQSYLKVSKDVRLNSTHFFIMKIPNKREFQQIPLNHSSNIDFKYFMKIRENIL